MEETKLEFSVQNSFDILNSLIVVLTLDETGKNYTVSHNRHFAKVESKGKQEELPALPKRVLKAFTQNAIEKILSKGEIPNESGMAVLDGNSYQITITKGDVCKEYSADDANIETYPLLRYLACWCRRLKNQNLNFDIIKKNN